MVHVVLSTNLQQSDNMYIRLYNKLSRKPKAAYKPHQKI